MPLRTLLSPLLRRLRAPTRTKCEVSRIKGDSTGERIDTAEEEGEGEARLRLTASPNIDVPLGGKRVKPERANSAPSPSRPVCRSDSHRRAVLLSRAHHQHNMIMRSSSSGGAPKQRDGKQDRNVHRHSCDGLGFTAVPRLQRRSGSGSPATPSSRSSTPGAKHKYQTSLASTRSSSDPEALQRLLSADETRRRLGSWRRATHLRKTAAT